MPLLNWLTREADIHRATQAPYRLLEEDPALSHGARDAGNMLIRGDNLDALKALLPYYAGKVKCIYIDPPYNTHSAFEHYDDNLEHTQWLAMMYPRLELLRDFLTEDGSIWVSIDDHEGHYLKVLMDEIFGRHKFVATNVWQKRYSRENREAIGDVHEYVVVYVKNSELFKAVRNLVPLDPAQAKIYRNPDNPKETDPHKRWRGLPMTAQGYRPNQMYAIVAPSGKEHRPPGGRCWSMIEPEFLKLKAEGRTWWSHEEVGHTDESKKEIHELFGKNDAFASPKPERLIYRILNIATNPGDLVLDSFLGSGTTAAVAHKMGRRYIGIEMGEHAETHCVPRLRKVIAGEQGGISEAVGWKGGGGFRFYRLGDPVFDAAGHIAQNVRFAPLAAHLWFAETGMAFPGQAKSPFLGAHDGTGYYLLFNGILGDKRPDGGNVLTAKLLAHLPRFDGPKVIFGESCRMGADRLKREAIDFRQIPYRLKAR